MESTKIIIVIFQPGPTFPFQAEIDHRKASIVTLREKYENLEGRFFHEQSEKQKLANILKKHINVHNVDSMGGSGGSGGVSGGGGGGGVSGGGKTAATTPKVGWAIESCRSKMRLFLRV